MADAACAITALARPHTLSPSLLVQVAVHTSLHQYILAPGLRLHIDVERLVRDASLDWEVVVQEVAAVGLTTRSFVSLTMAAELLGARIPQHVLEAMAPSARRAVAIFGILSKRGFSEGQTRLARWMRSAWTASSMSARASLGWVMCSGLILRG